jgi:hypothetical protein
MISFSSTPYSYHPSSFSLHNGHAPNFFSPRNIYRCGFAGELGILGVRKCCMTKRVFGVSDPSFSTHFHAFTLLLFSSAETVNRQRTWAGAPPPKRTFNDLLLWPTGRISLALTGRTAAARWAASRLIQDRTAMPNHLLVKRTITDLLVVLQIDTTTRQASSRATERIATR